MKKVVNMGINYFKKYEGNYLFLSKLRAQVE
jgi:hypothetical protein